MDRGGGANIIVTEGHPAELRAPKFAPQNVLSIYFNHEIKQHHPAEMPSSPVELPQAL